MLSNLIFHPIPLIFLVLYICLIWFIEKKRCLLSASTNHQSTKRFIPILALKLVFIFYTSFFIKKSHNFLIWCPCVNFVTNWWQSLDGCLLCMWFLHNSYIISKKRNKLQSVLILNCEEEKLQVSTKLMLYQMF